MATPLALLDEGACPASRRGAPVAPFVAHPAGLVVRIFPQYRVHLIAVLIFGTPPLAICIFHYFRRCTVLYFRCFSGGMYVLHFPLFSRFPWATWGVLVIII